MQKFDGFIKIPHDFVQGLTTTRLTGSEMQLFWVICALTIGYNRNSTKIALGYFEKATGINKHQAFDLLKNLAERNIIFITRNTGANTGDKKAVTPQYGINLDCANWLSTGKKGEAKNERKGLGVYCKGAQNHEENNKTEYVNQYDKDIRYSPTEHCPIFENNSGVQIPVPQLVQPVQKVQFVQNVQPIEKTATLYPESSTPILKNQYTLYQNFGNYNKEIDINKNTRKNFLKENPPIKNLDKTIKELILFSAQECEMTIIGDNVRLLEELLVIHSKDVIEAALLNFKSYHETPKEQRRFALFKTFKSFATHFDGFSTPQKMEFHLENENRWFLEEQQKKNATLHLRVGGHTEEDNEPEHMQTEAERQAEERGQKEANYNRAKQYVNRIEAFAGTNKFAIERVCKHYKDPVSKYEKSKAIVLEYEQSQQAA